MAKQQNFPRYDSAWTLPATDTDTKASSLRARSQRKLVPALCLTIGAVFNVVPAFGQGANIQAVTLPGNASDEVFLKTQCMQAALRPNAAWGHTVNNATLIAQGFNPQASGMGFMAKRDCSLGWITGNINGDYFMPGIPYEGWALRVGGSWTSYNHNANNNSGDLGAPTLNNTTNEYRVPWSHIQDGIQISKMHRLPIDGEQLHMDVTLTNTTGSAIDNIVYGRGVDPDDDNHNTPLSDGTSVNPLFPIQYISLNTVVAQYDTEAETPYALVTARFNDASIFGLFSNDSRAVVARQDGAFDQSFDPLAVWNGSGDFLTEVDSENLEDAGINLAVNVGTLAPGASTSFTVTYLLSQAAIEQSRQVQQPDNLTEQILLLPQFGVAPSAPTQSSPNLTCGPGLATQCSSTVNPNTGALQTTLTSGRAQFTLVDGTSTESGGISHDVRVSLTGSQAANTSASSQLPGSSSRLVLGGDGQTRVVTSGTVVTPSGAVTASVTTDGSGNSVQAILLADGRESRAELQIPGSVSTIDEQGNITSTAEFDSTATTSTATLTGRFRVNVVTRVDGTGETYFEYLNEATGTWQRISSTLDDGLSDNRFEPGHRVVISEEGGSLSVSIRTSVTQDMQF